LRLPQGLIPPARGHDPVKAAATGFSERQHILSTAKRLFAYFGYDGTSFDDIARAADIPAGQLLQLFEDKQKLLTAIFDEDWESIQPRMVDIILTSMDAREASLGIFAAMTQILDKDRDLAKLLLFESRRPRVGDGEVVIPKGFRDFADLMLRLAIRGQQDHTFSAAIHPRIIATLLISATEGLLRERMLAEHTDQAEAYRGAQMISGFDALVSGLKP
jgi:AcrR family transcriptional regulator